MCWDSCQAMDARPIIRGTAYYHCQIIEKFKLSMHTHILTHSLTHSRSEQKNWAFINNENASQRFFFIHRLIFCMHMFTHTEKERNGGRKSTGWHRTRLDRPTHPRGLVRALHVVWLSGTTFIVGNYIHKECVRNEMQCVCTYGSWYYTHGHVLYRFIYDVCMCYSHFACKRVRVNACA